MGSLNIRCIFTYLVLVLNGVYAAASWGFDDASVSVQDKGAGVGGGIKEKLGISGPLKKSISLQSSESLKVILTTVENGKPKRPHQAFLQITEPETGLDMSLPFTVKETGKAKIELSQKDLPAQLLSAKKPLHASIVIASFGQSKPYKGKAFDLEVGVDANAPAPTAKKPLRYGKLSKIHHKFRPDPKSPPKIVTLFFVLGVLVAPAALFATWLSLGANLDHLSQAFQKSPLGHLLFFGSIAALEGIFFMYYTRWNLFQTLPAAAIVGATAYLSGSRALTEVQERRLAGKR